MQVRTEHGVEIREEPTPEGWIEVDVYNPHSTPWDYYGNKHLNEYSSVLKAAGIEHQTLRTNRRILHPMGTGPKGSVRFGDDMTPGTYRVAVPADSEEAAKAAIEAHKQAIRDWLDNGAPMPDACR